jgi:multidrug efflux pump subunit AcrA (membrane-fusion protein)
MSESRSPAQPAAVAPAPPPRDSLGRQVVGWLTPVAILAAGVGVFQFLGSQPPPERKESGPPPAVPVRTVAVQPRDGGVDIVADGVVVPLREVTLAAEVAGRVVEKADDCRAGHVVRKGTVLFRIDPRDYQFEVDRLERELKQAGHSLEEIDEELAQNATSADLARRQVDLARREVVRLDGLKAGRIVTEAEYDRAVRDELTASGSLVTLDGQKRVLAKRRSRLEEGQRLAATMLERARLDLERTTVTAPVDGMIVDARVEQDSFVAKGTPVVTLEDTSVAEVKTSLEMAEVARIWGGLPRGDEGSDDLPDTPASVIYALGNRRYEWQGTLSRQEGRGLDEKTRTLPCRVRVADPIGVRALDDYGSFLATLPADAPRSLLRGMFVEVRVHVPSSARLVSIPEEAQRPTGEVWVMREGRLAVLRPRPIQVVDGRVIYDATAAGLEPGDRVVTSQIPNPRDGMAVAEAQVVEPGTIPDPS